MRDDLPAPSPTANPARGDLRNALVLFVENDPTEYELFDLALRRNGLSIPYLTAADGDEAWHILGGGNGGSPPESLRLILCDLKMPRVDGLALLGRVRADERIRHLPFVLFSASGEERDVSSAARLGVSSFVVKPIDYDKNLEMIRAIMTYWLQIDQLSVAGKQRKAVCE